MKISQEMRDYAAANGLDEQTAVSKGMLEKADEFKKSVQLFKKV